MLKLKDVKLLYVEDEPAIIKVMERLLTDRVLELYIAKDGEEAFELYKKHKPEIILADIEVPKINGLELISKIRENDLKVRVVLITAHSDKDVLEKAATLKLSKYLIKPIVGKELFESLEQAAQELNK